jgi:hypothetical protein
MTLRMSGQCCPSLSCRWGNEDSRKWNDKPKLEKLVSSRILSHLHVKSWTAQKRWWLMSPFIWHSIDIGSGGGEDQADFPLLPTFLSFFPSLLFFLPPFVPPSTPLGKEKRWGRGRCQISKQIITIQQSIFMQISIMLQLWGSVLEIY